MANSHDNRTSALQQWLEHVWYKNGWKRWISYPLLLPLSGLYCLINGIQRKGQQASQQKNTRTHSPIIVVGNITVGGTGKTPLTIHIVESLKKSGYKPAIITRGYGGKATSWPQSVNPQSDPNLVGDEAVLMSSRTQVPVIAGADRLASIDMLEKEHDCNVVVADDGLQHYRLPADIKIAVVDGKRQFGNAFCLPAGPLREVKSRLAQCGFIIVNGGNKIKEYQSYRMILKGNTLFNLGTKEQLSLDGLSGKNVHGVTGIGNPNRFFEHLQKAGLNVIPHSFPDHYVFEKDDLLFDDDYAIIMTEKDAVKCHRLIKSSDKYWMLPVVAKLSETFDNQLLEQLKEI